MGVTIEVGLKIQRRYSAGNLQLLEVLKKALNQLPACHRDRRAKYSKFKIVSCWKSKFVSLSFSFPSSGWAFEPTSFFCWS